MRPVAPYRRTDRWQQHGNDCIRARIVTKTDRWVAGVFFGMTKGQVKEHHKFFAMSCRTVIGDYGTPEEAFGAAALMLSMLGEDRQCTPRDIDRVRRELAKGRR
jgi:hypothetical protein